MNGRFTWPGNAPAYRVAPSATLTLTTRKLLPDPAIDAVLRAQFPKPGN
jgi:hypothetical protein